MTEVTEVMTKSKLNKTDRQLCVKMIMTDDFQCKFKCKCGSVFQMICLEQHEKSKKHICYINSPEWILKKNELIN